MGPSKIRPVINSILPISRRFVVAATVLTAARIDGCSGRAADAKTVLFICQYGSVKSPIARELLKRHFDSARLLWTAASRGLTPEDHASPDLRRALLTDGITIGQEASPALDAATLAAADIVVLFDALPAGLSRADARDWRDTPSFNANYAAARSFLDHRIEALATELHR